MMETLYLCLVVFLFLLAVFDLTVGVSNDAVNFLNSAIGAKAASFRRILIVASVGVFIGAAMSNGMMDIARHGIFRPEHFSFYDLMCIFMAVMVTDIILLDIFNTLGMPTSTTVSMVFELLGAAFAVALVKMAFGADLGLGELLNTGKALSVILGIFLSVAVAFFFGTVVQFISRFIFTFGYRKRLAWKIGIFGGICLTAISYFLLVKGAANLTFMTPEVKAWIASHTLLIVLSSLGFFTLLMQLLHACGVNVLKLVVLSGTFALAMAFAGNDLVNFIGVPLSGLSAYGDFVANGAGDARGFMMDSLNGPADTGALFLIGAGALMVISLATSPKVRTVTRTSIGLSSRDTGDEMFGSSRIARRLVRWSLSILEWVRRVSPPALRRVFRRRFDVDRSEAEPGAAFDLVRGSVNLVLAGALIALGTSLKLPLSTTFVTFMVAMGTSLADKAWSRESAVFRITGVISVIGGWFITAGAAFIGAGLIVTLMHFGGHWVMIVLAVLTVVLIVRNNRRSARKGDDEDGDVLFRTIITTDDRTQVWPMFSMYLAERQKDFIGIAGEAYSAINRAFLDEDASALSATGSKLSRQKDVLKNVRRKETLCLRCLPGQTAIAKSAWFHLSNNCCMGMLYNLRRVCEVCHEHVDNNFHPLPAEFRNECLAISRSVAALLDDTIEFVDGTDAVGVEVLRRRCADIKNHIADTRHSVQECIRERDVSSMAVLYVYVNMLQETMEFVSSLRKFLRARQGLAGPDYSFAGC